MGMTAVDLVFLCLVMLLGEEGVDYIRQERGAEEWQLIGWIHRN